jgi:hypothetical protein
MGELMRKVFFEISAFLAAVAIALVERKLGHDSERQGISR